MLCFRLVCDIFRLVLERYPQAEKNTALERHRNASGCVVTGRQTGREIGGGRICVMHQI